jgi:hypothetical protein
MYEIIKIALEKGWEVELHCWKKTLHYNFKFIKHNKFKIHFLDDCKFVKVQSH